MCLGTVDSVQEEGFFPCDFIKKRRYWLSVVPGKDVGDHFVEVEVEETYSIQGTVDDVI